MLGDQSLRGLTGPVQALERMFPIGLELVDELVVFARHLALVHERLLARGLQAQPGFALLPLDLLQLRWFIHDCLLRRFGSESQELRPYGRAHRPN